MHWFAAVHGALLAPAQVFVVTLQRALAHTAVARAVVQVPVCRLSLGSATPASSFVAHSWVVRLQYCDDEQSASSQQPPPPAGTQVPLAAQAPVWHRLAVPAVQPLCPLASPQRPLLPQTLLTHWFAAEQAAPFAAAQVFVVASQSPVAQVAVAFGAVQVPVCRVSDGIAEPEASFALQVKLERSQYSAAAQSASTQQPLVGLQVPLVLQEPDWHSAEAPAEQPLWPFARPQRLLLPHLFCTHWLSAVQAVLLAAAQVFVVALQAAVAQVAVAFPVVQVPVCSPSLGTATPAASLALQVKLERSQYCDALQSPST